MEGGGWEREGRGEGGRRKKKRPHKKVTGDDDQQGSRSPRAVKPKVWNRGNAPRDLQLATGLDQLLAVCGPQPPRSRVRRAIMGKSETLLTFSLGASLCLLGRFCWFLGELCGCCSRDEIGEAKG